MEKMADYPHCGPMGKFFQRRCKWLRKPSVHSVPTKNSDNPTGNLVNQNRSANSVKSCHKAPLMEQPRASTSQQKQQTRRPSDAGRSSTSSSNGTRGSHEKQLRRESFDGVTIPGQLGNLKVGGGGGSLSASNTPRVAKEMMVMRGKVSGNGNMGNIMGRKMEAAAGVLKAMGNEAYKKGEYEEALGLYERAIDLESGNAVYHCNKGAALIGLNRLAEAIEDCKMALQIDPSYHRPHHRLATIYLRTGEPEEALYHFQQSGAYTDSADVNKARALQSCLCRCTEARKSQRWETLVTETQYAISTAANSASKLYALQAEALHNLHRHQQAYAVYEKARNCILRPINSHKPFRGADAAFILSIEARVYLTMGRFEEGLVAAEEARRLDPGNEEVRRAAEWSRVVAMARVKGNALFRESRFSEACVAYSEGLESEGCNSVLLCNRAACRWKMGQYEKAVEDCTAALHAHPAYTKARLRRADCHAKMERWEAAIEDYEALIRESPGNEEVGRALFEARLQLKKLHGEDVNHLKFGSNLVCISSYERFRHFVTSPGMSVVLFCNKTSHKQVLQVFEQVYKQFPSLNFLKVEIEDHPYLAKLENVSANPAFKIYKNGRVVKEIPASRPHSLETLVKLYST